MLHAPGCGFCGPLVGPPRPASWGCRELPRSQSGARSEDVRGRCVCRGLPSRRLQDLVAPADLLAVALRGRMLSSAPFSRREPAHRRASTPPRKREKVPGAWSVQWSESVPPGHLVDPHIQNDLQAQASPRLPPPLPLLPLMPSTTPPRPRWPPSWGLELGVGHDNVAKVGDKGGPPLQAPSP